MSAAEQVASSRQHMTDFQVDFLLQLHGMGVPLTAEQEQAIRMSGHGEFIDGKKKEQQIAEDNKRHHLTIAEYMQRIPAAWKEEWKDREIRRTDWMPVDGPGYFDEDYCRFIDSHIPRFDRLVAHKPFYLFIEQSNRWMAEKTSLAKCKTKHDAFAYFEIEMSRMEQNALYTLDKFAWIKEAAMGEGGRRKWESSTPQAFLLFNLEQGRSVYLGKGRQAAITSTLGAYADALLITRKNLFIKYIAQDKEKGQEIFDDKIKYTFTEFEEWMKPVVTNDRDNLLRVVFSKKKAKGASGKASKIQTVTPSPGAVNGGGPDIVFIDEAPFISFFDKMIREARPSMFYKAPDGKLRLKRQVVAWGTGGEEAGKGVFEREYRILLDKWRSRDFSERIVPLFFDWTCRPGVDLEFYLSEMAAYNSGKTEGTGDRSAEDRMVMFRQHYPSSPDDMFSLSDKTLLPPSKISGYIDRIYNMPDDVRPTRGWFRPIFDRAIPQAPGSLYPFKVVDAEFIEADEDDMNAAVWMLFKPSRLTGKGEYEHRYWQGTDPIQHDNGYSKMASAIWDSEARTVPCLVNFRDDDPQHAFEQVALMGIYYRNHGQEACPEVVEANFGKTYTLFKMGPIFDLERSLVLRTELPDYLSGGANDHGVDCKGMRRMHIVGTMRTVGSEYGPNILLLPWWKQLLTFTCEYTEDGNERWGTDDARKFNDDVLFAIAYAYICRLSFAHLMPVWVNPEKVQEQEEEGYELVRTEMGLIRERVRRKPTYGHVAA